MDEFEIELQRYLQREELIYRIKTMPYGSKVDWLVPYCDSTEQIKEFLISIGFKIKKEEIEVGLGIVDDDGSLIEFHGGCAWVETTRGICVYVNDEVEKGLVGPSREKQNTSRMHQNTKLFDTRLQRHLKKCEDKYRQQYTEK